MILYIFPNKHKCQFFCLQQEKILSYITSTHRQCFYLYLVELSISNTKILIENQKFKLRRVKVKNLWVTKTSSNKTDDIKVRVVIWYQRLAKNVRHLLPGTTQLIWIHGKGPGLTNTQKFISASSWFDFGTNLTWFEHAEKV